jgi:nucleotide-binding universal stress UspA family protein
LVFAHQTMPTCGPAMIIADDSDWIHGWVRDILVKAEKDVAAAHPGVTVETEIVAGSPAAALVDESRTAGLVVVGTRATGGFSGHVSNSVAAQVAAHAVAPVVVLRPGDTTCADPGTFTGRPVIVGMDGSPESHGALEFAVEEAIARGAEVHAVFVWSVLDVNDIGPIVVEYLAAEDEATAVRLVTEATKGWSDRYPDLVITHRVVHAPDPVDALVRLSGDAGLVVVGSRGRGGFLGLRLGSTGDGLIRHAKTAVVVVPLTPTTP